MHEFELIRRYFLPLADDPAALGLSDDAALINVPPGYELVITKDAISQGVHFIGSESPDLIARKLLRVNLSDIAAMGAKPYGYFLAMMLPENTNNAWFEKFSNGLQQDNQEYGIRLLGGDTTKSKGALSLSLTMLGVIPRGTALRRNGAKLNDFIYVSGTLGDASLGLQTAQRLNARHSILQKEEQYLLDRYHLPQPRISLGLALAGIANSCMDISDGLMQDLGHIARASSKGAIIWQSCIPLSKPIADLKEIPYPLIVSGGDDYELLFTVPPEKLHQLASIADTITCIGKITEGNRVVLLNNEEQEIALSQKGYCHFT